MAPAFAGIDGWRGRTVGVCLGMDRIALVLVAGMLAMLGGAPGARAGGLFSKSEEPSFEGRVVVLRIGEQDLMSKQSFRFMKRMLERAEVEKAAALVIELDTPGGVVWETTDLMMNQLVRLTVPTYAFVNSRAISGGAMIAIATDTIYMAPAASIGAAGVITFGGEMGKVERAKAEGMVISSATSVAELKGHDPDLVRAMIRLEESYRRGPVKDGKDELVTLGTQQATEVVDGRPILAKGVAKDLADLLGQEGITAQVMVPEPSGFEQFAWLVSRFSAVLILIGLGAGYLELKTPGFGIGGTVSLLAFGLFFFGNNVAGNLAGYELLGVFVLGVVLIVLELFVFPGLILPGVLGGLLAVGALLFAMVNRFDLGAIGDSGDLIGSWLRLLKWPAVSLSIGVLGATVLMMLMMRYLPSVPIFRSLVLERSLAGGAGIGGGGGDSAAARSLVGHTGVAVTDLRPAGKADVDGRRLNVTCDGFIGSGTRVRVVEQSAFRIVVEAVAGGSPDA